MTQEAFLLQIAPAQVAYLFGRATKLGVSGSEYVGRLVAADEAQNAPVVPAPVAPDTPDPARDFVKESVQRAKARNTGDEFQLRALYDRIEWAKIPRRNRLGRDFRTAVEQAGVARMVRKSDMNIAIYERL